MTYELIYSHGGHGGPYPNFVAALRAAKNYAVGLPYTNSVEIHKRTDLLYGKQTVLAKVEVNRGRDMLTIAFWKQNAFDEIDARPLDLPAEDGYDGEGIELFSEDEIEHFVGDAM
jgi:hypothetical protein